MSKDIDDLLKLVMEAPYDDGQKRLNSLLKKYENNLDVLELVEISKQIAYDEGYQSGLNEDTIK